MIPRAISLSSRRCWRRGGSTCCCRPMSRDFCSRACRSDLQARSRSRRRRSTAIAPRTARPASADCLSELGLPQPATTIVTSESELRAAVRFPAVIKTSIGTASRGVWFVRDAREFDDAVRELVAADAFADEVLVQEFVAGTTEKAQSVFCRGELVGFHAYRRDRARRRRRRGDQGERRPAAGPRDAGKDRTTPRLARRAVDRLSDAGARPDAAVDRLQSAAGRADERLSRRHRSRRALAASLARRDASAIAGKPRGRPHASCDAGAARGRRARAARGARSCASAGASRAASDPTPAAARK